MLYLPALSFAEKEIRLPAFADDVIALCTRFQQPEESIVVFPRLLASSPGLLIYMAAKFYQAHQCALAKTCDQPDGDSAPWIRWSQENIFVSAIESDAFDDLKVRGRHLKRLIKWQSKPGRRRLIHYLVSATALDYEQAERLVHQLLGDGYCYPQPISDQDIAARTNSGTELAFAVRQMWLVCARLQNLQRKFARELLEQKMIAMKQLAYGASHEINNPLANIATRAQSLMAQESVSSRRQRLSVIYAQAMRAHEMISDMMLFAHPPAATFQMHDTVAVIDKIVSELAGELKSNDISIRIRQYPNVLDCEFDATQISVGIKAMIENAIIAIGSSGEIRIQVWREDEARIGISIADNGPGVDETVANQIFDPFFSGREAGRGLGFGLSKAWRIIELHSGQLRLDSEYQEGARFVITLPIQQPTAQIAESRIDSVRAA